MDKADLVAECNRLHLALSKANAQIFDLQDKLKGKVTRIKNLAQQVSDKDKSKQRLQEIVDGLRDAEHISEETVALLKVNHLKV